MKTTLGYEACLTAHCERIVTCFEKLWTRFFTVQSARFLLSPLKTSIFVQYSHNKNENNC